MWRVVINNSFTDPLSVRALFFLFLFQFQSFGGYRRVARTVAFRSDFIRRFSKETGDNVRSHSHLKVFRRDDGIGWTRTEKKNYIYTHNTARKIIC